MQVFMEESGIRLDKRPRQIDSRALGVECPRGSRRLRPRLVVGVLVAGSTGWLAG